ncbi:MAG: ATP-binding protein, partial [Kofleriaceae bacterium]|nr:ATP-binding protein [Kofleriaceae bacterium]
MTPISLEPAASERAVGDDSWQADATGTPPPNASTSAVMRQTEATLGAGELFGDSEEERTVVVSAAYELRPRFTGRSAALRTLTERYTKSCELRQLAYCMVMGDSGMGKSRLVTEFCAAARAAQPTTVLIAGAGDEASTPY